MPNPIIAPPSFDATRAAAYVLQRPHGAYTAQDVADHAGEVFFQDLEERTSKSA